MSIKTEGRTVRPGQKTFRAPEELLTRLDRRAMEETVALGVDVTAADIIRRGLDWALSQPVRGRIATDCLVVKTAAQTYRCLNCKEEWLFSEVAPLCGKARA